MKKGSLILAASIVAVLVISLYSAASSSICYGLAALGFRNGLHHVWLTVLAVFVIATGLSPQSYRSTA